jgi:hypothetical protein
MKKAKSILALGLLMLVMNSCVYSLFPIYTDDTLVFLPGLIGQWEMEGKSEEYIEFGSLSVEKNKLQNSLEGSAKQEKSYRIEITEGAEKEVYIGHIAKIGKDHFLDLYPMEDYSSNLIPVHTFIKLKITNNQLDLTAFNLEKLNKLFESNLIRLRHENVDGTVLITAQPKEIQKFIDQYSDDETVFEETEHYQRII